MGEVIEKKSNNIFANVINKIHLEKFESEVIQAILHIGRNQIMKSHKITFTLHQISKVLHQQISTYNSHRIAQAILYLKVNSYSMRLANGYERLFHVINAIEKPSNEIDFEKKWTIEIDRVLRRQILQSYYHALFGQDVETFNREDTQLFKKDISTREVRRTNNNKISTKGEKQTFEKEISTGGKILIPNQVFLNYHILSDGAVKLYFSMRTQEQLTKKNKLEVLEIANFTTISNSTFYRNIIELIKFNLVDKYKGNRKLQEKVFYSINRNLNLHSGYTLFDVEMVENMIYHGPKKLTDGELKLFTYLYYLTKGKGEIRKSQEKLAAAIGKKRWSISEMTTMLHEKEYIIKETVVGEDNKSFCRYIV